MALSLALAGEVDRAREILLQPGAPAVTKANAWIALAYAESNRKRVNDAESALRKALELEPRNPIALGNLANLLINNDRHGDAEEILRRAVALYPDDIKMSMRLAGVFMNRKDWTSAMPVLERVLRIQADQMPALYWVKPSWPAVNPSLRVRISKPYLLSGLISLLRWQDLSRFTFIPAM